MITDVPQLSARLYLAGELVGRSGSAADDLPSQIAKLTELHSTGALSDEEFAQAKQRLLAGPS
jgi:hypothetical protein